MLERFRPSYVRTIGVLPADIRRQGGIEIKPNGYLVLCANGDRFDSVWGNQIERVVVEALMILSDGGFMALSTKSLDDAGRDGFRYGNEERSAHLKGQLGDLVVGFLTEGRSYSREILTTTSGTNVLEFYESSPTPGLENKSK